MRKIMIGLFALLSFQFANADLTYAPFVDAPDLTEIKLLKSDVQEAKASATIPVSPKIAPRSNVSDLDDLFPKYATLYAVDENLMRKISFCESGYNPKALNSTPKEFSVGLSQINLYAHTNITRSQAEDPDFALNFLAEHIKSGEYKTMWVTCSE